MGEPPTDIGHEGSCSLEQRCPCGGRQRSDDDIARFDTIEGRRTNDEPDRPGGGPRARRDAAHRAAADRFVRWIGSPKATRHRRRNASVNRQGPSPTECRGQGRELHLVPSRLTSGWQRNATTVHPRTARSRTPPRPHESARNFETEEVIAHGFGLADLGGRWSRSHSHRNRDVFR